MKDAYINRISVFFPNEVVENDDIEKHLGLINGKRSKSRSLILRSNGIEKRYYSIDREGNITHTNAELSASAIRKLFNGNSENIREIDLLACGTTSPDQLLPSHAVMVHGLLPETSNIEVVSHSGACCAGMHALKYAYLSVKTGEKNKAVSCGSERMSPAMKAEKFQEEIDYLAELKKNPYLAFEKDFLRWMLSDGAGAFLIENKKNENSLSLKIEWIELCSFASEMESCMYMGAEKNIDGSLKSYLEMSPQEIVQSSALSLKQDVKMLSENIVEKGFRMLIDLLKKKNLEVDKIDRFLPHISSYFFKDKIYDFLKNNNLEIPYDKWFMNLKTKGNVGAGSIYIMLEEIFNGGDLKKGEKILLVVPESARFSYAFCLLTVC